MERGRCGEKKKCAGQIEPVLGHGGVQRDDSADRQIADIRQEEREKDRGTMARAPERIGRGRDQNETEQRLQLPP